MAGIIGAFDATARFLGMVVWGPHMLLLLIGTGLFLTYRLKLIQFFRLPHAVRLIVRGATRKDGSERNEGDISPFQALTTSLAAAVGNGNIGGVATAIFIGGPGAVFWIWVSAFLGMASKYSEVVLGVHFRKKNSDGSMLGGPMLYLRDAFPWKRLGLILAGFFAFSMGMRCLFAVSMIQSNSITLAVQASTGVPMWISGIVLAFITWIVIIGGIKTIARITEFLSPFMALIYMIGGAVVILFHFGELPGVISRIFSDAFTGSAATGGFAGATVMQAMRFGTARGVYSNEAGMGSAAVVHSAAKSDQPVRQGLFAMMDVFIDTIILCSISALAVLVTGEWLSGADSTEMTAKAFSQALPAVGGGLVALSSFLFGYSSLISWPYMGEQGFAYLFGTWTKNYFRWAFCFLIFIGSLVKVQTVWAVGDIFTGLMAVPNLIGLMALSGLIVRLTRQYMKSQG